MTYNKSHSRLFGIYKQNPDGSGWLYPNDKRQRDNYLVKPNKNNGAKDGEFVEAEIIYSNFARIIKTIASTYDPRNVSLVAIATHNIPDKFSKEALEQAQSCRAASIKGRTDLRSIPLITIDGADARDFDDAVFAEADPCGWHLIIAIADVAWYVRPGDHLDKESYKRGNSVYFPDRVVPMLPEELSNGWCSLKPDEERPCLAVHIWIDSEGNKIRHQFVRGLMRSVARLTYEDAQNVHDKEIDNHPHKVLLTPLYAAWKTLLKERKRRGVLELDLPERKVVLGENGQIERILPHEQLDSHRLIEDFMIAANVAAAEQIEALDLPCMYRVHDLPSGEKLEDLRNFLTSLGISFSKGQRIQPVIFNRIIDAVKGKPNGHMINEIILRSQAQAIYTSKNIGHFGLGLTRYAHFTSPIRRYADLLVHRALIFGLRLGEGGLPKENNDSFEMIGQHISSTERRAIAAEREVIERFTAQFLSDKIGAKFAAKINGVSRFGLFVTLSETGADGLVPISSLNNDFYQYDHVRHRLVGELSRAIFSVGDQIEIELVEANPLTGGLIMHIPNIRDNLRKKVGKKTFAGRKNRLRRKQK